MNVGRAKEIARQWVLENATALPGFVGAYLAGSITTLPNDSILPATSDVDVMVVIETNKALSKPGKFAYQGILLEITYMSAESLRSADQVLGHYHLAGSFRTPGVISDPSGRLTALQNAVANDFCKRHWVVRRCEHARDTVVARIDTLNQSAAAPFHERVISWLFAAGGVPHILLTAGMRNPTVRRRYEAVRCLLADYGHASFYMELLEQLGCADMRRDQVAHHLDVLASAFDEAAKSFATPSPFPYAADISPAARPIAIDGSREMIDRGNHREAIFWIAVTYSRCMAILHHAAPTVMSRHQAGYRGLLDDLGIRSFEDLQHRGDSIQESLPSIWHLALTIMDENREIVDQ